MMERFVIFIFHLLHESRLKPVMPIAMLAVTVFFASQLPQLKFNYDIERFFSTQDSEVVLYDEFKDHFGNENDHLLIGIESKSGLFNPVFLNQLDQLTKKLQSIEKIEGVVSPTNLKQYVKMPIGGFHRIPLIHVGSPDKYALDSIKIYNNQRYTSGLFSIENNSIALVVELKEGLSHIQNEAVLQAIRSLLENPEYTFNYHLAGRIYTQHYYIQTMKNEMLLFSILGLLLFCISLYLVFRRWFYVFIPLVVICVSLVWILGFLAWIDQGIDLMLTVLPTLIFILSTSVSIHYLNKYNFFFNLSNNHYRSVKQAFIKTSTPNLLISITTATGLASMYFIPVLTVQDFGLLAALGVLLALINGLVLIPRLLLWSPSPALVKEADSSLNRIGLVLVVWITGKNSNRILLVFAVFLVLGAGGISLLNIDNQFLDDLNEESKVKQDLLFFEREFSGIRPFEIVVRSGSAGVKLLTLESINTLTRLQDYLSEHYNLGMIQSPIVMLKSFNQAIHGGQSQYYTIPDNPTDFNQLMRQVRRYHLLDQFPEIINAEGGVARISGRMVDSGRRYYENKNIGLNQFLQDQDLKFEVQLTGVAYLIDQANAKVTAAFTVGLSFVLLICLLIIGWQARSLRLTMLALLVNLVPLLFAGALMGVMGIPLKISTALIFTLVLGIAVDDTIHFLHRYLEYKAKFSGRLAIKLSVRSMIQPVFYTSVVLFAGFIIFSLSSFESIRILGWLTGLSLLVAMLADILLLPLLILKTQSER